MNDNTKEKAYNEMSLNMLIQTVQECTKAKQRFCFILGAGASVASGIKSGVAMANEWLKDLKTIELKETEEWLKSENIDEKQIGSHYSKIFKRRFRGHPFAGYNWLQNEMKNAKPSLGYYYLANVLAGENSCINLAITTNFDSLTEDAIYSYTNKKPLVITHESLAPYMNDVPDRPIVAKIHRDLMLRPLNTDDETEKLAEQWEPVLKNVLSVCTPIIIGYGGNDDSLMELLEKAVGENKKSQRNLPIYWCYRESDKTPKSEKIKNLIEKSNGFFVPTIDFDTFMFVFGGEFGIKFDEKALRRQTDEIIKSYRENDKTIRQTFEFKGDELSENEKSFISFMAEKDQKRLEELDVEIKNNPDDYNLYNERAIIYFFDDEYEISIENYTKAIELDPSNAIAYNNRGYAYLELEEHEKAIKDYTKAIEFDGENGKTWFKLAHCYNAIGDTSEYQRCLAKSQELGYEPSEDDE